MKKSDLMDLFKQFNSIADRLKESYNTLQNELKETNTQLVETKKYMESIIECMPSGVVAVDLDGRITIFNSTAQALTGYNLSEVLMKPYTAVFNNGLLSSSKKNGEKSIHTKFGYKIPVRFSSSLVRDKAGRPIGTVEIFTDIREIKKLEEKAERAKRLRILGEMSASIAHEIKNPLAAIEGFTDILKRRVKKNTDEYELTLKIAEGLQSLNNILKTLLDFTRPFEIKVKRINLAKVIDSAITLAKLGENITLNSNYKSFFVEGDEELLRQAFLNIILNARDAMSNSGTLSITAKSKKTKIIVSISDTGPGIEESDLGEIFNPFFSKKRGGTGLGLSITQRIIEAHNGEIEARNNKKGAEFIITLPIKRSL